MAEGILEYPVEKVILLKEIYEKFMEKLMERKTEMDVTSMNKIMT